MFRFSKLSLAALTVGAGLLVAGCAADNKPPQSTLAPSTQGVTCTKCQVTWVKVPTDNGKGRIVGYTSRKEMVCPDCKDAVTNFFTTGKFQHTCKTCGDSMEICEAH
jgi:hypothetical protein